MTRHKRKPRIKWSSVYQWHRMIGLTAALFVIMLSISGWLLNRTDNMELDKTFIQTSWLLDWYGIKPPSAIISYQVGGHWISQLGDRLYIDQDNIEGHYRQLIGAIQIDQYLVVAVTGQLLVLSRTGELIEKLEGSHGVPAGMRKIGIDQLDRIIIRSSHGFYITDQEFLSWDERQKADAVWSVPQLPPPDLYDSLVERYRGAGLSIERVLLDIHSGNILGSWGKVLVDTMAVLFLLLAISGVWLWAKRKR